MKIALAGNPNSGKTTIFNALTGKFEKVGNWAGVTVERKESVLKSAYEKGNEEVLVVDLPGAYSMTPFTEEESITSDYIRKENPDVIINIVDATNLSRSLFLTTQLLELGIPVVVALNKSDLCERKHIMIDEGLLSKKLGCPVIKTAADAHHHRGLADVITCAYGQKKCKQQVLLVQEEERFSVVQAMVEQVETRKVLANEKTMQDRVDDWLTNCWLGIPFFAAVMFVVFYVSQTTVGSWISELLVEQIQVFQEWILDLVQEANPFLQALLVDGIIGGVGAVVGFLPLVMVMYFLIALLEDCGYMARATVVLDPIFKRVGLSGKSVIPMVMGTGCAIPGIMACRTIRDERERKTMAMLTPFMPCGAKLPVIALFVGAFFPTAPWIGILMYFVGILLILLGAVLVNAITGSKYSKTYFMMELPEYKLPSIRRAIVSMLGRGKAYLVKAGSVILICNTVVQIMQSFDWRLQLVEEGMEHTSILATIAGPMAYLLIPIVGVCAWQLAAAAVTGFIAKENVVGTLAVCYGLRSFIDTEELALIGDGNMVASAIAISKAAALAYLMFNLFTPPCFAALGAMNSEMNSRKWLWGGIALLLGTGYTVAFFVYQIGTVITTQRLGAGFIPGLLIVLLLILIVGLCIRKQKNTNGNRDEQKN